MDTTDRHAGQGRRAKPPKGAGDKGHSKQGTENGKPDTPPPPVPFLHMHENKHEALAHVHVPRHEGLEAKLKPLVERARDGRPAAIVISTPAPGSGMSHFAAHELAPALERLGCATIRVEFSIDGHEEGAAKMKGKLNVPDMLWRLTETGESAPMVRPEHRKWLPKHIAEAEERRAWRKECGIAAEDMPPYRSKVYTHTLEAKPKEEDDDDAPPWIRRHRRRKKDGMTETIRTLGRLAFLNRKVLALVADMRMHDVWSGKFAKNAAWGLFCESMRWREDAGSVLLIVCISGHAPDFVGVLRRFGMATTRMKLPEREFVKRVLETHQKESGFRWFTEDALGLVAARSKGRVGRAMQECAALAERGQAEGWRFPIDEGRVKENVKKGCLYEGSDVGIRF